MTLNRFMFLLLGTLFLLFLGVRAFTHGTTGVLAMLANTATPRELMLFFAGITAVNYLVALLTKGWKVRIDDHTLNGRSFHGSRTLIPLSKIVDCSTVSTTGIDFLVVTGQDETEIWAPVHSENFELLKNILNDPSRWSNPDIRAWDTDKRNSDL